MHQQRWSLTWLALAISMASCEAPQAAPSSPTAQDAAADEAEIRAAVEATETAINSRNFGELAGLFAADGDVIVVDSPEGAGPEGVRRIFETGWAEAPVERQIRISVQEIRFLTSDVALVDIAGSFSIGEPARDRATSIMVRQDGAWRIAALRVYPAAVP